MSSRYAMSAKCIGFATFLAAVAMHNARAQVLASKSDPSPRQTRDLTYEQVWAQTMQAESRYAHGYSMVGYNPAIMTIPDHPFTARRTYTEWPRDAGAVAADKPSLTTTVTIARDGAGRIHFESSRIAGEITVLISDPVEHLHYRYTVSAAKDERHAERCVEPPLSQITRPNTDIRKAHALSVPVVEPPLPKAVREELGTKILEGAQSYGQRRTNYTRRKTEARTLVTEAWFAPSLGLSLLEAKDFTGQNRYETRTHDLTLGEPDQSLFHLPVGYYLPGQTESCVKLFE